MVRYCNFARLNKICLHWTAGANFPNDTDLKAYHFCVDKLGGALKLLL